VGYRAGSESCEPPGAITFRQTADQSSANASQISGVRLLVDVQDGLLILLPEPDDCTVRLAGPHRQVWKGLDTTRYLQEERDAWDASPTG
jgi:hypothetical protein